MLRMWDTAQPTESAVAGKLGAGRSPLVALIALLIAVSSGVSPASANSPDTWTPTGPMATARFGATAALLPDGHVLVAGGCCSTSDDLASAELYDPSSGAFTPTASMSTPRAGAASTLLPDGRVLVAGGVNNSGPLASAELYAPRTGTWTPTGNMAVARFGLKAALLPDGRVLVAGNCAHGSACTSAEVYDPGTGAWTATGAMIVAREGETMTLLPNGQVLIAGGGDSQGSPLASAELYDPSTGAFTPTGSMTTARYGQTATLLPDGYVLIAGGCCDAHGSSLTSAELYDPGTGTFAATGAMGTARTYHVTRLLLDGQVLVTGGVANGSALASAEVYNPSTGAFTATSSMSAARWGHIATVLPGGQMLVAGGGPNSGPHLATAEVYTPVLTGQPVTTAALNPTPNDAGWNNNAVTVDLSATAMGAPVSATEDAVDNAACAPFAPALCTPYASPFTVGTEGRHTVYFYSVDTAGEIEAQHSIAVDVDETPPHTTASLSGTVVAGNTYLTPVQITLAASDTLSGVALRQYQLDDGPFQSYSGPVDVSAPGPHTLTYYSTDVAGNVEPIQSQSFTIATPLLATNRASAVPFQTVMLTGTGFSPLEPVQVYWDSLDSLPLTSTMATTTGGFVARLTVPQAVSGTHTLIAVGQSSGVTATVTVRVAPLLLLSPSSGRAGSVATAVGFGFGAAEPLKLYWDKPFTLLGSTTTDARGSFGAGTAIPATVPVSATSGLHYVVAVGPTNAIVGLGVFSVHS